MRKRYSPVKNIAIVQTSTEQKLGEDLAEVFQKFGRFRSILLVGHSNETGLVLTGDGLRGWPVVGNWLKVFEPEFCFLAACRADRTAAVRELFKQIKTLRHIYASPAALYRNQTPPVALIIGMLLKDGRINEDLARALRLINYPLTGGQLYRWRRADTGPGEENKGYNPRCRGVPAGPGGMGPAGKAVSEQHAPTPLQRQRERLTVLGSGNPRGRATGLYSLTLTELLCRSLRPFG